MSANEDGGWRHMPGTLGLTWVRTPTVQIVNGQTVPLRQPTMQAGPGGTMIPYQPAVAGDNRQEHEP